jgi:hypothetical protein
VVAFREGVAEVRREELGAPPIVVGDHLEDPQTGV